MQSIIFFRLKTFWECCFCRHEHRNWCTIFVVMHSHQTFFLHCRPLKATIIRSDKPFIPITITKNKWEEVSTVRLRGIDRVSLLVSASAKWCPGATRESSIHKLLTVHVLSFVEHRWKKMKMEQVCMHEHAPIQTQTNIQVEAALLFSISYD